MSRYTMEDLRELMRRLRDPATGCPWDLRQDQHSLLQHTLEEVYELADAVEQGEQAQQGEERCPPGRCSGFSVADPETPGHEEREQQQAVWPCGGRQPQRDRSCRQAETRPQPGAMEAPDGQQVEEHHQRL